MSLYEFDSMKNSISSIFPWLSSWFRPLPSFGPWICSKCYRHLYVSIINVLIIMNLTVYKNGMSSIFPWLSSKFRLIPSSKPYLRKMFLTFIRFYYKCLEYHEFNIMKNSISSIFPWLSSQFRLLPSSGPWICAKCSWHSYVAQGETRINNHPLFFWFSHTVWTIGSAYQQPVREMYASQETVLYILQLFKVFKAVCVHISK